MPDAVEGPGGVEWTGGRSAAHPPIDSIDISTKTASVHVSRILAKLGVSSRQEAAALAHRADLTRDIACRSR